MRCTIDRKHRIIDFYIEDDSGREYHDAMTFDEFKEFYEDLKWQLDNPTEES